MAFLAGATDVCGVARLRELYVSFMSGNTTMLGMALGQGEAKHAGFIAGLIALFVAGAALGAIVASIAGRWHAAAVAACVAVVLAVPLVRPGWSVDAFVLAMGALNAAMTTAGQTSVSLTYVTGTLVKFGQSLGQRLCGMPGDWAWLWHGAMWLSLLAGVTAAAFVEHRFGSIIWPLPALAALLASACSLLEARVMAEH